MTRFRHPVTGCRADQLFAPNLWAIEPTYFEQMVEICRGMSLVELKQLSEEQEKKEKEEKPTYYRKEGPVAIIPISGPITKHPSSFSPVIGGGSTLRAEQGLNNALKDPTIDRILIHIDNSPGGTAAGVPELVDRIKRVDQQKPVYVHIDDTGASAAYFVASAGRRITANKSANVGSIGTMAVLYDTSKRFEQAGVKPVLIASGKHKGIGVEGLPITEEQQAVIMERINDVNKLFTQQIKESRKLTDAELDGVADGRVFVGQRAKDLKLVDEIMSFEDCLNDLTQKSAPRPAVSSSREVGQTTAATQRSVRMYDAQQMVRLRALPGGAQATEENSDAVALSIAQQQSQRVTELQTELETLRPKVPTGPVMKIAPTTQAAGHVRLMSKELDLLQKGDKLVPEQTKLIKDAVMAADGTVLPTCAVTEEGTVLLPADKVVQALEMNKPKGILREVSKDQPQPREIPGSNTGTLSMTDAVDAAIGKNLRRHYGVKPAANGAN